MIKRLQSQDQEVMDLLGFFKHVLVDEAQDLVGPRYELVRLLLENLGEGVGATVFGDPHQAIYDYAEHPC